MDPSMPELQGGQQEQELRQLLNKDKSKRSKDTPPLCPSSDVHDLPLGLGGRVESVAAHCNALCLPSSACEQRWGWMSRGVQRLHSRLRTCWVGHCVLEGDGGHGQSVPGGHLFIHTQPTRDFCLCRRCSQQCGEAETGRGDPEETAGSPGEDSSYQ